MSAVSVESAVQRCVSFYRNYVTEEADACISLEGVHEQNIGILLQLCLNEIYFKLRDVADEHVPKRSRSMRIPQGRARLLSSPHHVVIKCVRVGKPEHKASPVIHFESRQL